MPKFYAVKNGRQTGIFDTWQECKQNTAGYKNAIFKSFLTKEEAQKFLECNDTKDTSNLLDNQNIIYHKNEEEIYQSLLDDEMVAYIDGSYDHKKLCFSYAGIMFYNQKSEEFAYASKDENLISMRNVAGEIKASIYVIQKALDYNIKKITLYYDYSGIQNWARGYWKCNNNLTKDYKDFFDKISHKIDVNFVKVKSHSKITFNEYVDKLAKKTIQNMA